MEPNRERIQMWVDALRSGKYKQGTRILKDAYGNYCCLGVACEISGLGRWETGLGYVVPYGLGEDYSMSFMPKPVGEWYGLGTRDVFLHIGGGECEYVTVLNDVDRFTFEEIAYAIEREFLV